MSQGVDVAKHFVEIKAVEGACSLTLQRLVRARSLAVHVRQPTRARSRYARVRDTPMHDRSRCIDTRHARALT